MIRKMPFLDRVSRQKGVLSPPPTAAIQSDKPKDSPCGFTKLPAELLLEIVSLISPIDFFALKLAGNRNLLEAVRSVSRTFPFSEYVSGLEIDMRQPWTYGPHDALMLGAARGQLSLVAALLDTVAKESSIQSPDSRRPFGFKSKSLFRQPLALPCGPDGKNALHWAAECGQLEAVRLLLKYGVKASCPMYEGSDTCGTAIHLAAAQGHESTVRLLLREHGKLDSEGVNVLETAAKFGQYQLVQGLLDSWLHGSNPEGRPTPLMSAAQNGHIDTVQLLIDKKSYLHKETSGTRYSALCNAASNGHDEIVRLLLKSGVVVEPKASNGKAIDLALWHGHFSTAQLLLDLIPPKFVSKAEMMAQAKNGHFGNVYKLLCRDAPRGDALHAAAGAGHRNIVQLLLDRGEDIERKGPRLWTPLHAAAFNHQFETAVLLLKKGASVDVMDENLMTPLHWACFPSEVDEAPFAGSTVSLLIQRGASLHAPDGHGRIPLHIAAASNEYRSIDILLAHGQGIEKRDDAGNTPLLLAAQNQQCDAARRLLDARCDIYATNKRGATAFHLAARPGGKRMFTLERNRGANKLKNNHSGPRLYNLLKKRGADATIRHHHTGRNPLQEWDYYRRTWPNFPTEHISPLFYPFYMSVRPLEIVT